MISDTTFSHALGLYGASSSIMELYIYHQKQMDVSLVCTPESRAPPLVTKMGALQRLQNIAQKAKLHARMHTHTAAHGGMVEEFNLANLVVVW